MSFYYQCECGERINKITAISGNYKEDTWGFYDDFVPIVQCQKCGAKYKIKKPSKIIINIALFVGLLIVVILKFTLEIGFFISFIKSFGMGVVVVVLSMILNNYFEKIDENNNAR